MILTMKQIYSNLYMHGKRSERIKCQKLSLNVVELFLFFLTYFSEFPKLVTTDVYYCYLLGEKLYLLETSCYSTYFFWIASIMYNAPMEDWMERRLSQGRTLCSLFRKMQLNIVGRKTKTATSFRRHGMQKTLETLLKKLLE